jgi:hypothetical protein
MGVILAKTMKVYLLAVLGFEVRGFVFVRQALYHLSYTLSPGP